MTDAGAAVLRRGGARAAYAGAEDGDARLARRTFPSLAHRTGETPGANAVIVAVEALPVLHGDLDLRSSFGGLPRAHALGAVWPRGVPYAAAAEPLTGALVDRYV